MGEVKFELLGAEYIRSGRLLKVTERELPLGALCCMLLEGGMVIMREEGGAGETESRGIGVRRRVIFMDGAIALSSG